jgi:two-component system chemotaxis response regulator CheB
MQLVVIGASLGGFTALSTVLGGLPDDFPVPIAVAQHRAVQSGEPLKQSLQRHTPLRVREAQDKETLMPCHVYLAPSDYHLLVERGSLALSTEAPVNSARPSIDVLFETAAEAYQGSLLAVVLTGASHDGARGAAAVKREGGKLIVQDPDGCESAVMPRAAIAQATADHVAPIERIAELIRQICAPADA